MASINLQGDTSGAITISAPSVAGSNTLTLPATTQTLATQNALGVRNLIINGDMRIDQRNAGAEVVPANDAYTLDRWKYNSSQASKLKVQQNAQAINGPTGFKNYLGVTVNTAYTVTASDNFMLSQSIEGFNTSHLEFGTANAKTITLSFWVQSSLTGTFSGALQNSAENRSYPFDYTISSANTWEYKTITVTGDTSGTWIGATNGKGLKIWFSLGMGSNFTGTANQWNAAQDFASSSETVKLVENSAAQWKVTAIQLEVGDTATPFEHRPYDMELARCQRYYEKSYIYETTPGSATPGNIGAFYAGGTSTATTTGFVMGPSVYFNQNKRATPSIVLWDTSGNLSKCGRFTLGGSEANNQPAYVANASATTWFSYSTGIAATGMYHHWIADAEL